MRRSPLKLHFPASLVEIVLLVFLLFYLPACADMPIIWLLSAVFCTNHSSEPSIETVSELHSCALFVQALSVVLEAGVAQRPLRLNVRTFASTMLNRTREHHSKIMWKSVLHMVSFFTSFFLSFFSPSTASIDAAISAGNQSWQSPRETRRPPDVLEGPLKKKPKKTSN